MTMNWRRGGIDPGFNNPWLGFPPDFPRGKFIPPDWLPPGSQAPSQPTIVQLPDNRPFYMKYDQDALMELIRGNPAYKDLIPKEIRLQFPNEYFLEHPEEQGLLDEQRRRTFGTRALKSPEPFTPGTAPGQDTRSAAAGDKTGFLTPGGPSGIGLHEPDVLGSPTTPILPGVAAPILGQKQPTFKTSGGVPMFSSQSLARMTPGERQATSSLINRAGGRAEDFWEQQRKLFSAPRGSGAQYSRARRY